MGGEKIALPNAKTATEDDWNNFFAKIGRPDSPDKYDLSIPKEANIKLDDNFLKNFKENAHKAGLAPKQVSHLFNWYAKSAGEQIKAMNDKKIADFESNQNALKKEWGETYDDKVDRALVALNEFGGEGALAHFEKTGLAADPMFLKIMEKVGADGSITVESGKTLEHEVEYIKGLEFDRGFSSPYFITNHKNQSVTVSN